jgi:hypothetical protein
MPWLPRDVALIVGAWAQIGFAVLLLVAVLDILWPRRIR